MPMTSKVASYFFHVFCSTKLHKSISNLLSNNITPFAMAASMAASVQALGRSICPKAPKGLALTTLPFRKTGQPEHVLMKRAQKYECMKIYTKNRPYEDHRLHAVISSTSSSNFSPSDTVEQFYECINKNNLKKLGKFISNDCYFEDFSFPKPFQGRKVVSSILKLS